MTDDNGTHPHKICDKTFLTLESFNTCIRKVNDKIDDMTPKRWFLVIACIAGLSLLGTLGNVLVKQGISNYKFATKEAVAADCKEATTERNQNTTDIAVMKANFKAMVEATKSVAESSKQIATDVRIMRHGQQELKEEMIKHTGDGHGG